MRGIKRRKLRKPEEAIIKRLEKIAGCNEECANGFYYGQGCKACFWLVVFNVIASEEE